MINPPIPIYLLPGGRLPERQTEGAIGYDVYLRAIVSPTEMDSEKPNLRKTIFDFRTTPSEQSANRHVRRVQCENGKGKEIVYVMDPGESVLVGIGFITAMEFPMFYWVAPRSGLASRHGITVTNAPGTVDPDYRGEAGVLVYNRNKVPFSLRHGIRIAQIIFQWALIPKLNPVSHCNDLPKSNRGAGGFGSTGLR